MWTDRKNEVKRYQGKNIFIREEICKYLKLKGNLYLEYIKNSDDTVKIKDRHTTQFKNGPRICIDIPPKVYQWPLNT